MFSNWKLTDGLQHPRWHNHQSRKPVSRCLTSCSFDATAWRFSLRLRLQSLSMSTVPTGAALISAPKQETHTWCQSVCAQPRLIFLSRFHTCYTGWHSCLHPELFLSRKVSQLGFGLGLFSTLVCSQKSRKAGIKHITCVNCVLFACPLHDCAFSLYFPLQPSIPTWRSWETTWAWRSTATKSRGTWSWCRRPTVWVESGSSVSTSSWFLMHLQQPFSFISIMQPRT